MARRLELSEAKLKAARFCAFQERSPKEVSDKLYNWGLTSDQINETIDLLIKEGYIDSQRFANAYCNDKFEFNSWGKLKIRSSIHQHQLDSQVIENALNRIDDVNYFQRVSELTEKKWESLLKDDLLKRKQKTVAYMVSKGFEHDLIWKAMAELLGQKNA